MSLADSDDSDSSSEDYSEGRHGDVSGDVSSEDGEPDASSEDYKGKA